MEILAQYLDSLEDICYAVALKMERIRRVLQSGLFILAFATFLYLGIRLALARPPMGLVVVSLLTVSFLYFGATGSFRSGRSGA